MALSNLDKDNLTRLFSMISTNNNLQENNLGSIKQNYATYAKLEVISNQIENLKLQAKQILDNHNNNIEINSIHCNFKKVPGTIYYLYEINGEKKLSLISNDEFYTYLESTVTNNKFLGKYLYNYDHQFYLMD
tara:strand:- start:1618 stop:2016 length:399 start_codon:yes stop_codon:yes gene_type:complete